MSQIIIPDMPRGRMIRITNAIVYDLDESVAAGKYAMQTEPNPANTEITDTTVRLAQCEPGTGHDNFLCGIRVAFDIRMTAKCLVELERYHFADIVTSNSTMHRITRFDLDNAYCKYVDAGMIRVMNRLVKAYNDDHTAENLLRVLYSNPVGFYYTMRIDTNYRQLKTFYIQRRMHRLPEWREMCEWIEQLPHSELIVGVVGGQRKNE